jgi:Pregnancy-associated plasma protein-A/Secretion system C-terminal sorting domain
MKLRFVVLLLIFQMGFAQKRTCGVREYMNKMLSDREAREKYFVQQEKFKTEYHKIITQQSNKNPNATIKIPVAVHFPEAISASASLKNCLSTFAQNQINILNADYNATNSDLSNWSSASTFYPGVSVGDLDVEFILADQNHPAGTGLVNGNLAVTFGTDFLNGDDSDLTWKGYMNFVVRNIGGGILGYSPVGGVLLSGQTVVIDNNAFASGSGCLGFAPNAPFNLGRTVTHELGHFFNLDHIFKSADDTSTDCSGADQDGISDTPKQAGCTYGCIAAGSRNACISGQKVLSMNYMDYSDDACMYMFTQGQKNVMLAYINSIKSQFAINYFSGNVTIEEPKPLVFSVHPNPSDGALTIQFEKSIVDFEIYIYDIAGRAIDFVNHNEAGSRKSIDIKNATKGIYFVSITYDNKRTTTKIAIK